MRVKRTPTEIRELEWVCARAIQAGPLSRGPDPADKITEKSALERAQDLVRHCLHKPVTENG